MKTSAVPIWRVLLVLGRVSNLPTVWSNCIAGWHVSGGGNLTELPCLFAGASCLYVSGMFLNDAFDASHDKRFSPNRPIPSGSISATWTWILGIALLLIGLAFFVGQRQTTTSLALSLAGCILLYNWIHKRTISSPVIMAGCRSLLFLTAASMGDEGVTGHALWLSLALAAYIVGLSFIAKGERQPGLLRYWPLAFLLVPAVFAILLNDGPSLVPTLLILGGYLLWTGFCLWSLFHPINPNPGKCVSGLLAGIIWVDMLASGGESIRLNLALLLLFLLARLFQRHIPAT